MNITSWWTLDVDSVINNKSGFLKVKLLKVYKYACSIFDLRSEK